MDISMEVHWLQGWLELHELNAGSKESARSKSLRFHAERVLRLAKSAAKVVDAEGAGSSPRKVRSANASGTVNAREKLLRSGRKINKLEHALKKQRHKMTTELREVRAKNRVLKDKLKLKTAEISHLGEELENMFHTVKSQEKKIGKLSHDNERLSGHVEALCGRSTTPETPETNEPNTPNALLPKKKSLLDFKADIAHEMGNDARKRRRSSVQLSPRRPMQSSGSFRKLGSSNSFRTLKPVGSFKSLASSSPQSRRGSSRRGSRRSSQAYGSGSHLSSRRATAVFDANHFESALQAYNETSKPINPMGHIKRFAESTVEMNTTDDIIRGCMQVACDVVNVQCAFLVRVDQENQQYKVVAEMLGVTDASKIRLNSVGKTLPMPSPEFVVGRVNAFSDVVEMSNYDPPRVSYDSDEYGSTADPFHIIKGAHVLAVPILDFNLETFAIIILLRNLPTDHLEDETKSSEPQNILVKKNHAIKRPFITRHQERVKLLAIESSVAVQGLQKAALVARHARRMEELSISLGNIYHEKLALEDLAKDLMRCLQESFPSAKIVLLSRTTTPGQLRLFGSDNTTSTSFDSIETLQEVIMCSSYLGEGYGCVDRSSSSEYCSSVESEKVMPEEGSKDIRQVMYAPCAMSALLADKESGGELWGAVQVLGACSYCDHCTATNRLLFTSDDCELLRVFVNHATACLKGYLHSKVEEDSVIQFGKVNASTEEAMILAEDASALGNVDGAKHVFGDNMEPELTAMHSIKATFCKQVETIFCMALGATQTRFHIFERDKCELVCPSGSNGENRIDVERSEVIKRGAGSDPEVYIGYAVDMLKSLNAQVVFNDLDDMRFSAYAPARSIIVAPVISADSKTAVGVLEIIGKANHSWQIEDDVRFSVEDLLLAKRLSRHLSAVALLSFNRCRIQISRIRQARQVLEAMKPLPYSSNFRLDPIFNSLKAHASALLNCEDCRWFLFDNEEKKLWTKSNEDSPKMYYAASSGLFGIVFGQCKTINMANGKSETISKEALATAMQGYDAFEKITGRKINSLLAMPIFSCDVHEEPLGVVEVINKKDTSSGFTDLDVRVLEIVATHAAHAVNNFTVVETALDFEKSTLQDLQLVSVEEVSRVVERRAKELTGAEMAQVFVLDTSDLIRGILGKDAAPGRRMPIAAQVAATGMTVNILDTLVDTRFHSPFDEYCKPKKIHNMLSLQIPLRGDSNVAVLQVYNKSHSSGNRAFTEKDIAQLNELVKSASVTLHHAMLYEYTFNMEAKMEMLLSCTNQFGELKDVTELLRSVSLLLKKLIQCDKATVFMFDQERGELWSKITEESSEIRFSIAHGVAGYAARSQEFLHIPDAYKDSRFNQKVDKTFNYHTRNILCYPLVSRENNLLGVVQAINKLTASDFSEDDISIFKSFAQQTRNVIESWNAQESMQKMRSMYTVLPQIKQKLGIHLNKNGGVDDVIGDPVEVFGVSRQHMLAYSFRRSVSSGNDDLDLVVQKILRGDLRRTVTLRDIRFTFPYHEDDVGLQALLMSSAHEQRSTSIRTKYADLTVVLYPTLNNDHALEGVFVRVSDVKHQASPLNVRDDGAYDDRGAMKLWTATTRHTVLLPKRICTKKKVLREEMLPSSKPKARVKIKGKPRKLLKSRKKQLALQPKGMVRANTFRVKSTSGSSSPKQQLFRIGSTLTKVSMAGKGRKSIGSTLDDDQISVGEHDAESDIDEVESVVSDAQLDALDESTPLDTTRDAILVTMVLEDGNVGVQSAFNARLLSIISSIIKECCGIIDKIHPNCLTAIFGLNDITDPKHLQLEEHSHYTAADSAAMAAMRLAYLHEAITTESGKEVFSECTVGVSLSPTTASVRQTPQTCVYSIPPLSRQLGQELALHSKTYGAPVLSSQDVVSVLEGTRVEKTLQVLVREVDTVQLESLGAFGSRKSFRARKASMPRWLSRGFTSHMLQDKEAKMNPSKLADGLMNICEIVRYRKFGDTSSGARRSVSLFSEGLELYRAQKFADARNRFKAAVDVHEDALSRIFLRRCGYYIRNPPPKVEKWDGVWKEKRNRGRETKIVGK